MGTATCLGCWRETGLAGEPPAAWVPGRRRGRAARGCPRVRSLPALLFPAGLRCVSLLRPAGALVWGL